MNLRKFLSKGTVVLAFILLPVLFLLTTNTGLNTILTAATMFAPIPFSYDSAKGQIIGQPIEISNLFIALNGKPLKVGLITFDWQQRLFTIQDIQGLEGLLPLATDLHYNAMMIDKVHGYVALDGSAHILKLQLHGHMQNTPIVGTAKIMHVGDNWHPQNIYLKYGNNLAHVAHTGDAYTWNITLIDPTCIFKESAGAIAAQGQLSNVSTVPTLQAHIAAKNFSLSQYQVKNLLADLNLRLQPGNPLHAKITASKLSFGQQQIQDIMLTLNGTLEKHSILGSATYKENRLALSMAGHLQEQVWRLPEIIISYNKEQLQGMANYDFTTNSGNANLQGSILQLPTKASIQANNSDYDFNLSMHANEKNHLQSHIKIANTQLFGNVKIIADDLSALMQWMPDITRLKGKFSANLEIAGSLDKPEIITQAQVTDITATIPSLGIKIKPMALYIRGDKHGKFILNGTGKMRRGPGEFTVHGYIEPFKTDIPNALTINTTKLEFVNNQTAHLLASSALHLHFDPNLQQLDLNGDIEIHEGNVTISDKRTQTIKSKDVVFVNEPIITKHFLKINPNINLRISNGVHFMGFGLDADITGKLNISRRHDALYGDGRISIKQGTYQLPGQKLEIEHGRLLFPPGTLLVNPVLDIRMLGKDLGSITAQSSKPDLELLVQGTAQKPLISESGLSSDKDRAISQAMLTGSSVLSNNLLQDKLKITEIGLTSREEEHVDFFDDPAKDRNSLKNKDLVIGRSLGKKFYVQYLHSIGEANQRIRLKYALNNTWSIGLESGTVGGGIDLSFAVERD